MVKEKIDLTWANHYVGIPYKVNGRDEDGCDCYGLVRLVLQEQCNIELPPLLNEYKRPSQRITVSRSMANEIANSGRWVQVIKGHEKQYDVLLGLAYGFPMHVGIVVGKKLLLHVEEGCNTVTVDYRYGKWKEPKQIVGFYRHISLCKNQ